MSSSDEARQGEITDTQLDQLLAAANRELLDRIEATADLHRTLIAIMTWNTREASDTAVVAGTPEHIASHDHPRPQPRGGRCPAVT